MQGNWTVCVPLKYLILMSDIQKAKFFEFTVQMFAPPLEGGGLKNRKHRILIWSEISFNLTW